MKYRVCKKCRTAVTNKTDYYCPECNRTLTESETELEEWGDRIQPLTRLTVKLIGTDGNAFALLGKVRTALRRAGYESKFIERFTTEATQGSYEDLLMTIDRYVQIM